MIEQLAVHAIDSICGRLLSHCGGEPAAVVPPIDSTNDRPNDHALLPARRLKDLNQRCPGELKAYYECMDYYR